MKFVIDTLDFEISRSMIEVILENELGNPVTVTECKETKINEEHLNEPTDNEHLLGATDEPDQKRWRAERHRCYYYFDTSLVIRLGEDTYQSVENHRWEVGNYFRYMTEAERMVEKIKQLLKGEMVRKESEK